ncbi:MAG: hypothetical protein NTZ56_21080 [Acidobacteria bacterium]|nr:hypothetical protein [Acidobacteriota bacterium]
MATLAQIFTPRFSRDDRESLSNEGRSRAQKGPAVSEAAGQVDVDVYQLRPLPYEDFLYVKNDFNNHRVVRQADPTAGRSAWKAIGSSCIAAALLIALLLPGAYRLLAGYQISRLKLEREQYSNVLRTLDSQEASLVKMERLYEVARTKGYAPPTRDQVQYSQPKDAVARLEKSLAGTPGVSK